MDGSSKNHKTNGVLFRPVSLSQALDQFTPMIYDMLSKRARVTTNSAADGIYSILVYGREGRFWTLRQEDYDKCLAIARKIVSPCLFPSSPQTTLEIIRSYIKVVFAGRV